jgi:hypothetical protein
MFFRREDDTRDCGERTLRPTHTELDRLARQAGIEVALEPPALLAVQLAVGHRGEKLGRCVAVALTLGTKHSPQAATARQWR